MNPFTVTQAIRRYAGKLQTIRNQVRTERVLNELPDYLRKDIGWPDRFNHGGRPFGQ